MLSGHLDLPVGDTSVLRNWRAMPLPVAFALFCSVTAAFLPFSSGAANNVTVSGQNATKPQRSIKIAILLPNSDQRLFSIHRVSPAIAYAIENVERRRLIPSVKLSVKYADSWCDIALSMNEAINFYMQKQVHLFLGPACDYAAAPVARQSKFWKVPMVTAGSMHRDFGINKVFRYTYLTRIGHNIGSLGGFLVSVFTKFDWRKIILVYDPKGHQDIMHQYCHITMDGLHYDLMQGYPDLNIIPDYSKFDQLSGITDRLPKVIGNEYGVTYRRRLLVAGPLFYPVLPHQDKLPKTPSRPLHAPSHIILTPGPLAATLTPNAEGRATQHAAVV